jgi:hypothetical protein
MSKAHRSAVRPSARSAVASVPRCAAAGGVTTDRTSSPSYQSEHGGHAPLALGVDEQQS